jgi:hypothetical protein
MGNPIIRLCLHCFTGDLVFNKPGCYKVGSVRPNELLSYNYTNGIGNNKSDGQSGANAISKSLNNLEIDWMYNPTGTLLLDVLRSANELYNFSKTNLVQEHIIKWQLQLSNPEKKVIQICFSEGTIIVRNALMYLDSDLRKRIFVIAIGPGAYISPKLCGGVEHICSSSDPVTYIDQVGRRKYWDTITHVRQLPNDPIHQINSRTYLNELPDAIKKIKSKALGAHL